MWFWRCGSDKNFKTDFPRGRADSGALPPRTSLHSTPTLFSSTCIRHQAPTTPKRDFPTSPDLGQLLVKTVPIPYSVPQTSWPSSSPPKPARFLETKVNTTTSMPKAEVGSQKWLGNKMKSKGLQRLRWYCQACEKQCTYFQNPLVGNLVDFESILHFGV